MYLSFVYSLTIYKRIKELKSQILVPNLEEVKKKTKHIKYNRNNSNNNNNNNTNNNNNNNNNQR